MKKPKTVRGLTAIFNGKGECVSVTNADRIYILSGWTTLRGRFVANVRQPKK